jgi:hypothetical protein
MKKPDASACITSQLESSSHRKLLSEQLDCNQTERSMYADNVSMRCTVWRSIVTVCLCHKRLECKNVSFSPSEEVCVWDRVSKFKFKLSISHASVGLVTRRVTKELA